MAGGFRLHRAILLKLAGEGVRSFAIITTTANELCAELHNRMPVKPWARCLAVDDVCNVIAERQQVLAHRIGPYKAPTIQNLALSRWRRLP
jgi:hypothetical protein